MKRSIAPTLLLAGVFSLSAIAQESPPPKPAELPAKNKGERKKAAPEVITATLTAKDPTHKLRSGCHYHEYERKLTLGMTYVITMNEKPGSRSLDPYLRLENAAGQILMEHDDIQQGVNLNAQIVFLPTQEGLYKIVATTCDPGRVGDYTLKIQTVHTVAGKPGEARATALGPPVDLGDVSITPLRAFGNTLNVSNPDTHGYIEYRYLIENHSETEGHKIKLSLLCWHGGFRAGRYLEAVRKTVEVGPGATVLVSLYQPDLPFLGGVNCQVEIDGRPHEQDVPTQLITQRGGRVNNNMGISSSGAGRTYTSVLTPSAKVHGELTSAIWKSAVGVPPAPTPSSGGSSRSGTYQEPGPYYGKTYTYWDIHRISRADSGLENWSHAWLGYGSLDGIAVSGADLDAAPREVKAAVWQYVECGGTLLVLGTAKLPESWERVRENERNFAVYYPGFGQCLVARTNINTWDPDDWRLVTGMWTRSAAAWNQVAAPTDANREFPIVEGLTVPVRGLFVTMIGFVLLIGPLNFFWLSRTKRRIWMLWTVPTASLATCVLLVGYMLATEGWHGHIRAEGVTVLDETTQRAASIGWFGAYSPMTSGGGLRFSLDTELTPHLRLARGGYSTSRHPLTIDWTHEQHFQDGWLTAKVPLHLMTRRGEKRLERVTLRKGEDGSLALVNGLGADITMISLAAADGKIYTASDVRAGAEAKLQATEQKAAGKLSKRNEAFAGSWAGLAEKMAKSPADYLRPGCYLAVIEDSPFLELGLRQVQSRKLRSVVYGIPKEPL